MSDCIPGTYTGSFSTTVGVADGGFPSTLFGVPWNGTLSIALLTSGTMLTVAPGARISGADQMGGTFAADVSGQLDCVSRVFVGALSNGVYSFFGDAATTTLTGTLSATYDSTSNPVALVGGSLDFRSPQVPGVEAAGTWSATRR
jgi:hypothetical protein